MSVKTTNNFPAKLWHGPYHWVVKHITLLAYHVPGTTVRLISALADQ
jgi:hypothetical protein